MHIHTSKISVSCTAEGHPVLPLPMGAQGGVQRSLALGDSDAVLARPTCGMSQLPEAAAHGASVLAGIIVPLRSEPLTGQPWLGGVAFVPE